MRILKEKRKIHFLYHYTKNENVDKILSSGKITSQDSFIFFTDSYDKSISLFEKEMMSNNYYYDLDCKLKRRSYARKKDYKIIKIPYHNDGNFVRFKFNTKKKNIYDLSIIHNGEIHFSIDEVEVLDVDLKSKQIPKYFNYLFSKIAAFLIIFLPFQVRADTWLDKESYRDTSWFNESTYNSTNTYTIDSSAKLAGLLYEVNEKGYTFSGKTIKINDNNTNIHIACGESENYCLIDMTEHDWVPLNSNFAGTFDTRQDENNPSCGSHRVLLKSINKRINFIENNFCKKYSTNINHDTYISEEEDCSIPKYKTYYTVETTSLEHGETDIDDTLVLAGQTVTFWVTPDKHYSIDYIEIIDKEGNQINVNTDYSSEYISRYSFIMPNSLVKIKPHLKYEYDVTPGKKQFCKVISSTGKKIGDEIVCGTEHFYIIKSNKNDVQMISKYNLYTGVSIYKEKINKEEGDTRTDAEYCDDLAIQKEGIVRSDNFYNSPGYCYISIPINSEKILQKDTAISAHWDTNDNYSYPQVGDYYINGYYSQVGNIDDTLDFTFEKENNTNTGEIYGGYFYDLYLSDGNLLDILKRYKNELIASGYDLKDIDLLTLDNINTIVKNNNKSIPYADWYNHTNEIAPPHFEFGSLRDFLSDEQRFLYGTTYWLRTGYERAPYINNMENKLGVSNIIFINTNGGVCGSGINGTITFNGRNCQYYLNLTSQLGAGIRPVITLSQDNLLYLIKTETDNNGTIEVVENALGGNTIQFKVQAKKGYKLKSIIIKTDSGEEIEFEEGEITKNTDGTISIDKNKFKMPFENITIQAKWVPENILVNPKTGRSFFVIIVLTSVIAISYKVSKKKLKK